MKKSLLALAVLSAITGAASAQSSVTLSGAVDLGVRRSNGVWSMTNAGSSRTNLNFSGTEDLGGGMNVFFNINHRFNANTGQQRDANAFYRQAWVGLGGGFGNIRLGKILPPLQDFNGQFEPWDGGDTVASIHTGGLFAGNTNYGSRYVNSIYYRTPVIGGLVGHAMIAAGDNNSEVPPSSPALQPGGAERPVGLGVIWGGGPVRVAAAYDRNADDKKTFGLYGSFNAGFATLMAQYEKGDIYTVPETDVKRWSIGANIPFGAAVLKAGYARFSDEEKKKLGLGVYYSLSKRTTLYSDVGKNSGDGWTDPQKKTMFDVGIHHRF